MRIPSSFYRFQSLVAQGKLIEDSVLPSKGPKKSSEKSASYLCDYIMSTLISTDHLKDAVVDTIYNEKNGSILFVINNQIPEEALKLVVDFFKNIDLVDKVAFGKKRNPQTGDEIRLVKVQGKAQDYVRSAQTSVDEPSSK